MNERSPHKSKTEQNSIKTKTTTKSKNQTLSESKECPETKKHKQAKEKPINLENRTKICFFDG